ncbi:Lipopolysaccharide export system permease protein LptG [Candidatus Xiphinematobacter sp. Idaho Grape]|uniref:LptF/LptG family permease n=1 Tax=Candidatus Xiphinematobacter sp. Idaho Grape TaxID=1704307 RepID=UPI0007056852|nr:LptF/LptG family permease [Candidatus Xiphinematobacter sp. Idaho Grape]ALJ56768.1 Lipopolysaccharide export system permease protein LptG [Candidatus Xiphinematobacter sp. Idaho Grape]
MTILDRYLLKKFLTPFFYCVIGFTMVWFIFDLSDNLSTFLKGRASFSLKLRYYWSQLPATLVLSLPVGTLLALLYSLSAMSRSNEIISMLAAGKSVLRVLGPLLTVGLLLVGVTSYFNWSTAPHARHIKRRMLNEIKQGGTTKNSYVMAHMFRNRRDHRLWFMRRVLLKQAKWQVEDLQVVQQNACSEVTEEWFARKASYDPFKRNWTLSQVRHLKLDPRGNILKKIDSDRLTISHWSETPQRIASLITNPDYLSVPELREYLAQNLDSPSGRLAPYRTHLEYRFALPWQAMVAILLAGPLGIVYSRYSLFRDITIAIILFFCLIFLDKVSIALGEGNHVSPFVAAWAPLIGCSILGCWFLWLRSTNRDIPSLRNVE